MDVDTDEDLLQRLAAGGAIDYAAWPQLLCTIVTRIESIAQNDFPIPVIPLPAPPAPSLHMVPPNPTGRPAPFLEKAAGSADPPEDDIDKENASPSSSPSTVAATPTVQPVAEAAAPGADNVEMADLPAPDSAASENDVHDEPMADTTASATSSSPPPPPPPRPRMLQLASSSSPLDTTDNLLPPQVVELLNQIISTLTTAFAQYPPFTIQRLAELVLLPRQHYRSLPTYLHAVNRVISVSSCSNIYPLPPAVADMTAMSRLTYGASASTGGTGSPHHGANGQPATNGEGDPSFALMNVGSDEALGGALLTPIPWLRGRPPSSGGSVGTGDEGIDGIEAIGGIDGIEGIGGVEDGLVIIAGEGEGGENSRIDFGSEAGSSPPSTVNGSTTSDGPAFSTTSSMSNGHSGGSGGPPGGGGLGGLLPSALGPQLSSSFSPVASSSSQQPQPTQPAPSALPPQPRRMEVRTETTETIDGPNGVGSIETVSVSVNGVPSHGAMLAAMLQQQQQRGITQGELLRQEQKAGVVPVSQLARAAAAAASVNTAATTGAAKASLEAGSSGQNRVHPGAGHRRDQASRTGTADDDDGEDDAALEEGPGYDGLALSHATEPSDGLEEDRKRKAAALELKPGSAGETEAAGKAVDGDKDEDKDDEDAIPHARGPREIGAVDMGPQSALSTTAEALLTGTAADDRPRVALDSIAGAEAAVGRKADALPAGRVAGELVPSSSADGDAQQQQHQTKRAGTPKREAEPGLEQDVPAKKKRKDDWIGEDGEAVGRDGTSTAPAGPGHVDG